MTKEVFINLPVKDVLKAMDFYLGLGFTNNPHFSDDQGKCMVWSEHIYVMLLSHEKFSNFTHKSIADTKSNIAGLFALSVSSFDEINEVMEKGLNAGGVEPFEAQDYSFMKQRTIEDLDGHTWEIFYMDMEQVPKA
ncbi:VOC family protein [Sphingobacterium sp. HJSM2_6]|uniref:VOC family protein n=1 Tax=Sphingobacterium sp. HJSM2_6 TaxID=3366264 RepID=UPI003BBB34E6